MKTEITAEEYINIFEVCNWDTKPFSIVLKRLGYSDELIISGNLDLRKTPIQSLGNLKKVGGGLWLNDTSIQSLGNLQKVGGNLWLENTPIQDLGNLQTVGGSLDLDGTPIRSLGNLKKVEGHLWLQNTPLSEKYSEEEIRQMIKVGDNIYT